MQPITIEGKPGFFKATGLKTDDLRCAVIHTRQKLGTSERRTCKILSVARSTQHYKSAPKDNEEDLRLALISFAKQYGRYGYRKIAALLPVEGWQVNHQKVERIWREEGLQLLQRHKKRRRLYHKDSSVIRMRPKHPNHIWSIRCPAGKQSAAERDFVDDKLSNGKSYKMLTVIATWTASGLFFAFCRGVTCFFPDGWYSIQDTKSNLDKLNLALNSNS